MSPEPQRLNSTSARWILSALIGVVGAGYFVAATVGGKVRLALEMLGIMIVAGVALLLFGERSETIRGLRGDGRDERFALMDLRASAYTAFVLVVVIVGGFIYELVQGRSGAPYFVLGAIAGVTYIISVAVLRIRS